MPPFQKMESPDPSSSKRPKLDSELLECGLTESPSLLAGYGLDSQVKPSSTEEKNCLFPEWTFNLV